MSIQCETLSLEQAEQLTGLPGALVQALAQCGEVPSEIQHDALRVGKAALLAWCCLFAKVFTVVIERQPREHIGGGVSARNLVWLAQAGRLSGRKRISI